jgi:serine phosphatase RsbU (regulator of sigma subunit)
LADRRAGAGERGAAGLDRTESAYETGNSADLARDNGLLYARERYFSEALQYSFLTAPPRLPALQIAVRYLPASDAFKVGGDWYDAFVTGSGATVLVVGDVIGHDTAAAVSMGQLRTLLRGIAFTTEDLPAAVLSRLEASVEGLDLDIMATAIVARLEQHGGTGQPPGAYLRWSSAGHPPPLLLRAEGEVVILGAGEADLLLGVDPASARSDLIAPVANGSTVLLYSDGLVERRRSGVAEGVDRLAVTLGELGDMPLERFCDEVLTRMLPDSHEDDVVLLALRLPS